MPATPQEIFERYVWAGMTQNADALAEMVATDGVFEAPLVSAGRAFPRRLDGREEISKGLAAYYQRSANADRKVKVEGIVVLAACRPGLHGALLAAKAAGHTHVILDGTLIGTDRISAPGPTPGVDLWWSGKHHHRGGNIQVLSAPTGGPCGPPTGGRVSWPG